MTGKALQLHRKRKEARLGKKDLTGKQLEEYADVFADIYNHLLFEKEYLQEKGLQNDTTQSVYHSENGEIRFQDRDIIKKYNDGTNYVIANFGIENQAAIDKTMPIRVMQYDASGYHKQMKEKASSIYPVITIVLNLTEKRWTAPKSVHELVSVNEEMKQYVSDYQIRVFDIAYLPDTVIDSFNSDFKEIAFFLKRKRQGKNPFDSTRKLKHYREVLEFMSAFTQDKRYRELGIAYLEEVEKKGGEVTMCRVADALVNQGINQGISQGIQQGMELGRIQMLAELGYEVEDIVEKLHVSRNLVEKVIYEHPYDGV